MNIEREKLQLTMNATLALYKPELVIADRRIDDLVANDLTFSLAEHVFLPPGARGKLFRGQKISFVTPGYFERKGVFDPNHMFSLAFDDDPSARLICMAAGKIDDPISGKAITSRSRTYQQYAESLTTRLQRTLRAAKSFGITTMIKKPVSARSDPGQLRSLLQEVRFSKDSQEISRTMRLAMDSEDGEDVFEIFTNEKEVVHYKIEGGITRKVRLGRSALILATDAVKDYREQK